MIKPIWDTQFYKRVVESFLRRELYEPCEVPPRFRAAVDREYDLITDEIDVVRIALRMSRSFDRTE